MKKKITKSMDSGSFRIYLMTVKRQLLNNLSLALFSILPLTSTGWTANLRPHFVVLSANADLQNFQRAAESSGAKIMRILPPDIVILDFPDGVSLNTLPSIKRTYEGIIHLTDMEPLGIMALAAGVEWNKSLLADTKRTNPGAYGSMSKVVSKQTLLRPESMQASLHGMLIHATWKPAAGALLTHIQVSRNAKFTDIINEGKTDRTSMDFPIPFGATAQTVYVRMRSTDRPDAMDLSSDMNGEWSPTVTLSIPAHEANINLTAPVLTSPIDFYQSGGFTLILEWTSEEDSSSRIQLSKSENFDHPWMDVVANTKEFVVPSSSLHVGEKHFWRVMNYGSQQSAWSTVRQFTVGEPSHHDVDTFVNPEAPQ